MRLLKRERGTSAAMHVKARSQGPPNEVTRRQLTHTLRPKARGKRGGEEEGSNKKTVLCSTSVKGSPPCHWALSRAPFVCTMVPYDHALTLVSSVTVDMPPTLLPPPSPSMTLHEASNRHEASEV